MDYDGALSSNIHYLKISKRENKNSLTTNSLENQILNLAPCAPVYVMRPNNVKKAASFFLKNFNGKILYSVKSNPEKSALIALNQAGVNHFDVASLNEVKLISSLFPSAKMYFMHPIKSRESIREAYFNYGIRDFSLDSFDELQKILDVTKDAKDLGLHVRLAISNSHSAIDLSSKNFWHLLSCWISMHGTYGIS
jgi:ornithine decarboxylase